MSAVEEYLTANAEFEAAKTALTGLTTTIIQFGSELARNPEGVHFANTSVGLPMDIAMSSSSKTIDANAWPTPDQIHTAIMRRYQAKRNVQTKWNAVPEAMRASLVAPRL